MKRIAITLILGTCNLAGCGSDLCPEHRAIRSVQSEEEKKEIQRHIDGRIRFALIGVPASETPPVYECPVCDKIVERMLMSAK